METRHFFEFVTFQDGAEQSMGLQIQHNNNNKSKITICSVLLNIIQTTRTRSQILLPRPAHLTLARSYTIALIQCMALNFSGLSK